jgi:hypothetical protein
MTNKPKRRYTPKLRNKYNKSKTRNNHTKRRHVNSKTSSFFGGVKDGEDGDEDGDKASLKLNEKQVNKFQQVIALIRFATNSMINSEDEKASVETILNKDTLNNISKDPQRFIEKLDQEEAQVEEQQQAQVEEQQQVQAPVEESDSDDEYDPNQTPTPSKLTQNFTTSPGLTNNSNNGSKDLGLSVTGTRVQPKKFSHSLVAKTKPNKN